MLVNFSSTLGTYWIFLGQKKWLIFHPLSTLISPSGWLPKAITAPWKCSLRVQWWNTFQLGPKKPPKPLLAKNKFQPQTPKSHSQPSVHWHNILLGLEQTYWIQEPWKALPLPIPSKTLPRPYTVRTHHTRVHTKMCHLLGLPTRQIYSVKLGI